MIKFKILAILLFLAGLCSAQKNPFFTGDESKTIKAVANGALYILRQDYYVIDTSSKKNQKIGLNNQKYFGRYYFVAILADGKFYTDKNINTPWILDAQFNTIKGLKKYIPALSSIAYKGWNKSEFNVMDSLDAYNSLRVTTMDSAKNYTLLNAPDSLQFLKLATNEEKLMDSTSYHWSLSVNQSKVFNSNIFIDTIPMLDFDLSKGKYSVGKNAYENTNFFYNEKTIGGFIFTTKPSFGKVEYFLSGLIVRNKNGKFDMVPLVSKQKMSQSKIKVNKEIKDISAEPQKKEPGEQIKLTKIKETN